MSYPSNIVLPTDAKYFGFVDPKYAYNTHWDITWSFSYALTGVQHGFCTYLASKTILYDTIPGHHLGYSSHTNTLNYDESPIVYDNELLIYGDTRLHPVGPLAIAFDSTGYFALGYAMRGCPSTANKLNKFINLRIR